MALRACFDCLKFCVFTVNFLFWIAGLVIMGMSVWVLAEQRLYLQELRTDYFLVSYLLLSLGAVVVIVGFFGCCGAWRESTWMLAVFFVFLAVVMALETILALLLIWRESAMERLVERTLTTAVQHEYFSNETTSAKTIDALQQGLRCCGAKDPSDWSRSVLNNFDSSSAVLEIGIGNTHNENFLDENTKDVDVFSVPHSCCFVPKGERCAADTRHVTTHLLPNLDIYQGGCAEALLGFLHKHLLLLAAVFAGVLVLQAVTLVATLALCCIIKRIDDLKT